MKQIVSRSSGFVNLSASQSPCWTIYASQNAHAGQSLFHKNAHAEKFPASQLSCWLRTVVLTIFVRRTAAQNKSVWNESHVVWAASEWKARQIEPLHKMCLPNESLHKMPDKETWTRNRAANECNGSRDGAQSDVGKEALSRGFVYEGWKATWYNFCRFLKSGRH